MSTSSGDEAISYSLRTCKRCDTRLVPVQAPGGAVRWLCTSCGKRTR